MTHVSFFGKQGYTTGNAFQAISNHENSSALREAMIQLLQRSDRNSRVDTKLVRQANTKHNYRCTVLGRVEFVSDNSQIIHSFDGKSSPRLHYCRT